MPHPSAPIVPSSRISFHQGLADFPALLLRDAIHCVFRKCSDRERGVYSWVCGHD